MTNKITQQHLIDLVANSKVIYTKLSNKMTHCLITLPNGFQVTGESACVDPTNYLQELGEKYALEKATDKLWELEGYLLANNIYQSKQPTNFIDRLIIENSNLLEKLKALDSLLQKPKPERVSDKQWYLLQEQQKYMTGYFNTLDERIEDLATESGM